MFCLQQKKTLVLSKQNIDKDFNKYKKNTLP